MKRNANAGIRILFGITLVLFAAQIPLIYAMKREPYPALTMPSFAGHPDASRSIERNEPVLHIRFSDGSSETTDLDAILPSTRVLTGHVLRAFGDDDVMGDARTVAWLRTRIEARYPSRQVSGADINWRQVFYTVGNGRDTPTRSVPLRDIHVDFGNAS